MAKQYFIMDNLDVIECGFCADLDDVIAVIKEFDRTDAITVVEFDLSEKTCAPVTSEAAYHWYSKGLDFNAFDDCNDFPDFIRSNVSASEIQSDWAAFNTPTSELVG